MIIRMEDAAGSGAGQAVTFSLTEGTRRMSFIPSRSLPIGDPPPGAAIDS